MTGSSDLTSKLRAMAASTERDQAGSYAHCHGASVRNQIEYLSDKDKVTWFAGHHSGYHAALVDERQRMATLLERLVECVEALTDISALAQHIQDLEYLTQGGSTEGWAHRCAGQSKVALQRLEQLAEGAEE